MNDLEPGDYIEIDFVNAPEQSTKATIRRVLSDQQEGLSPEVEDYVCCWLEISVESEGALAQPQTIMLGADWRYYIDGRQVEIRKCSAPASHLSRGQSGF